MMTSTPWVVMLVIDQLPASLLGPYGNTMIETTSFNRLASQSLVFDFAMAYSLDLRKNYRQLLLSLQTDAPRVMISDDPLVANLAADYFDRVILIEQVRATESANNSAATQLANFFAQASAWIAEELEEGQLCWIHSRGLTGDWDAPYDLRLTFAGDDDPDPPRFVSSPSGPLVASLLDAESVDPDVLLGYQQAAAAQVVLLDDCLGVLLDQLDQMETESPGLLVCTSLRGCGLGEHGWVGVDQQLYSEAIHVPLMIRFPEHAQSKEASVGRSSSLISVERIMPLIGARLDDNEVSVRDQLMRLDQVHPNRSWEVVAILNETYEMLQTHAWKLIRHSSGAVELYAKPDDRWEINDVSDRCPLIVEKLVDLLDRRVGHEGSPPLVAPLEDELVTRRD